MIQNKLNELGLQLPPAPKALAAYVPALRVGSQIWVSGQLPMKEGLLLAKGSVPAECSVEIAKNAARQCLLNALAAAADAAGGLQHIKRLVQITGYVQSNQGFAEQPQVINGASELALQILGDQGQHVRAAVGVSSLPLNASVEIAFVFQTDPL